ncbi:MAG: hypothetical protein L3J05_05270 [Robiginitomaculum sp.]|nr:hypothetical protein [Robiginitomaculum sp.]
MKADPNLYMPFMQTLRDNMLFLADALSDTYYEYDGDPVTEPTQDFQNTLDFFKQKNIVVPAPIIAFYQTIGSIEFTGTAPSEWSGCEYADPISIAPATLSYIRDEFDMWESCKDSFIDDFPQAQFAEVMAGDHTHKAGYSGGIYHLIFDGEPDAQVSGELINHRFCDYLKLCNTYSGFPGLRFAKNHTWPLEKLSENFLPLPNLGQKHES